MSLSLLFRGQSRLAFWRTIAAIFLLPYLAQAASVNKFDGADGRRLASINANGELQIGAGKTAEFLNIWDSSDPQVIEFDTKWRPQIERLFKANSVEMYTEPDAEGNTLKVFSKDEDQMRLDHYYKGYPVFGSQILVMVKKDKLELAGVYLLGIDLNAADYLVIDAMAKAEEMKRNLLKTVKNVLSVRVVTARTIVYMDDNLLSGDVPHLAYQVELAVTKLKGDWRPVTVTDVRTGAVLRSWDALVNGRKG